jgi:hypothetical protein
MKKYLLNSGKHLEILREMKGHARNTFRSIQTNDYDLLAGKYESVV